MAIAPADEFTPQAANALVASCGDVVGLSRLDILDLRTLLPLDYEAIRASVKRTGKVLLLHEDTMVGGLGGELAAWISENCFECLDAPIVRCASLDTPVPLAVELEQNFMANSRLDAAVQKLQSY